MVRRLWAWPDQMQTVGLRVLGALMLGLGLVALYYGPMEMVCFSFFVVGGRFHYEGFGFGSFMFGNLAVQIMGYYLVALVCIPLGYGHLRLQHWARSLMVALIWCWRVLGVPLSLVLLFILLSAKDLSFLAAVSAAVALAVAYLLLPELALRWYRSSTVRGAFESAPESTPGPDGLPPVPVLVAVLLESFFVVALHVLLFFNGLFPLWGTWATGQLGFRWIAAAVVVLVALTWGTFRRWRGAWWGALLFFGWMLLAWTFSLFTTSWSELLGLMAFASFELEMLSGMPIQGWHLAVMIGVPLALTLVALLRARPYFSAAAQSHLAAHHAYVE